MHDTQMVSAARAEEVLYLCLQALRGWEWHFRKRRITDEPSPIDGHTNAFGGVPEGLRNAAATLADVGRSGGSGGAI
jgi:hypothetical protein